MSNITGVEGLGIELINRFPICACLCSINAPLSTQVSLRLMCGTFGLPYCLQIEIETSKPALSL